MEINNRHQYLTKGRVKMRLIDTGFYRKNIVVADVRRRYDRHLFFCRILGWFGLAYQVERSASFFENLKIILDFRGFFAYYIETNNEKDLEVLNSNMKITRQIRRDWDRMPDKKGFHSSHSVLQMR